MPTLEDEEAIFNAALDCPPGNARSSLLDAACGGDLAFRQRIELLLSAYGDGQRLQSPAAELAATALLPTVGERAGDLIGPYKLLEQIGEGGMGLVFMAEQTRPLRRRVALKIIKPGLDTRSVIARFEAERQALALMDHPNIARVYDAGATEGGRPYFVMELVRGASITDYCRDRGVGLRERLKLFIAVCEAVQHAHQKGVIHRDLKPTNILVSHTDLEPVPKVIDFGVAKATCQPLTERTLFTHFAQIIGTPLYMSPEQADLGNQDIDTRSDVFSLGVVLYELLTGVTPFDSERLKSVGAEEMRRIIREVDPPKPSTRATTEGRGLSTVGGGPAASPKVELSELKGDLDWIVMKAVDKDRTRRYQSASALAEDLDAFLRNDPVSARSPTTAYLLAKFARKNRMLLAASAFVLLTSLLATAISLRQAQLAVRAQRLANASLAGEKKARAAVSARENRLRAELYAGDMADAWQLWEEGDVDRSKMLLNQYLTTPSQADPREFSWRFLNARCDDTPTVLGSHRAPILTATLAPDGHLLASTDRDGTVKIWDLVSRRQLTAWNYSHKEVTTAAFSPDGRLLATAGQDATIRIWRVSDWTESARLEGHDLTICSVSWSPNGDKLASGSRDNSIRIWNCASYIEEACLADNEDVIRSVVWLPDGKHLAASVGKTVRLWHAEDWKTAGDLVVHKQGVLCLAVSPDGRYLASGGYDTKVHVCDLVRREVAARLPSTGAVWSLAFDSDGRYLFGGLGTGGPSIWRINRQEGSFELVRRAVQRGAKQRTALLDPARRLLVTASEDDRLIRLWEVGALLPYSFISFPEDCLSVAADRDWAICAANDGSVVIHRVDGSGEVGRLRGHQSPPSAATVSASRRWLATSATDGDILLWNLDSFRLHRRFTVGSSRVDLQACKLEYSIVSPK